MSWLDRCGWDPASKTLHPPGETCRARLAEQLGRQFRQWGITLAPIAPSAPKPKVNPFPEELGDAAQFAGSQQASPSEQAQR